MRAQEIKFVEGPLDFAQDVLGNAAQIVIPEAMEGSEKPGHNRGRIPACGTEGAGNGSANWLLGERAN